MTSTPFKLILLVGFVIFVPIGLYHRLKSRTGEKLDRRQEGLFILNNGHNKW